MILFSAEAILAPSTSKFGIEIPRVDEEDLNSSTESTNSTSLIHCIASVGNCELVHTSVLNLIFQQAKVAGVGNLPKMEIRKLQSLLVCPIILRTVSSTEDDWIFGWRSRLASQILISFWSSTFLRVNVNWFFNSFPPSRIQFLRIRSRRGSLWMCKKRFLIYRMYSKYLAAPQFVAVIWYAGFNNPSNGGCLGNNPGGLVTWEFPLRTDSASWKS